MAKLQANGTGDAMRAAILALSAAAAFAGQVQAQVQAQPGGPPSDMGPPPPGGRLYISPAGEPFRGGDGLAAWFAGADADHDGALSPDEFRADAERFFKVLDKDGNGALRGPELQAYEREVAPEIVGFYGAGPAGAGDGPRRGEGGPGREPRKVRRHDGGGRPMGGGGRPGGPGAGREGAARFSLLNIPQPVTGSDLDGDRKVTLDEWTRTARIRFGLLDKAGAGRLALDALPPLPGAPPRLR
jgi:hypothetical protein